MKSILKLIITFLIAGILFSCKKNVVVISYEDGTPPVLTASTTNVSLEPGQEGNMAITINWTNPDYRFTTGISSHDVTYTLEMDTMGANFSSSKKVATVIARELSKSYTVGELNAILGNDMLLQLNPRRNYTMELRVISSIGSALKLTSNVISFTTKPFAPPPKVTPPTAGTLWMTGDACSSGWSNPLPSPYDANQKFTMISPTLYELTVSLPGGGGYKLIQEQGNWDTQYHMLAGGTWQGGDFKKENADPTFPGPPSAGNYKITVDFQIGKFTAVKL
jgi:starch-binding outer membrane protein SusE/F